MGRQAKTVRLSSRKRPKKFAYHLNGQIVLTEVSQTITYLLRFRMQWQTVSRPHRSIQNNHVHSDNGQKSRNGQIILRSIPKIYVHPEDEQIYRNGQIILTGASQKITYILRLDEEAKMVKSTQQKHPGQNTPTDGEQTCQKNQIELMEASWTIAYHLWAASQNGQMNPMKASRNHIHTEHGQRRQNGQIVITKHPKNRLLAENGQRSQNGEVDFMQAPRINTYQLSIMIGKEVDLVRPHAGIHNNHVLAERMSESDHPQWSI